MKWKSRRTIATVIFLGLARVFSKENTPLLVQGLSQIAVIVFAGWCALPLIARLFDRDPLLAWIASRPLGLALLAWGSWWAPALALYPRSRIAIEAPLVLLSILSDRLEWKPPPLRECLRFEFGFWLVFFIFVFLKIYTPEIYWGEKPMDFTFFNFFARNEVFPPEEPWAAGLPLHYYYFGSLIISIPTKLLTLTPGTAYLIWLCVLPAFLYSGISFFLLRARLSANFVLWAGILALFLSGFPVFLHLLHGVKPSFELFWLATRSLTEPSFAEFPLWTFLFGDLHAHVIALPYLPFLLAFLLFPPNANGGFLGLGFLLGLAPSMNTWDAIAIGFVAPFFVFGRRADLAKEILPALLAAVVCFFPMVPSLIGASTGDLPIHLYTGPWNRFMDLIFFFAPFLIGITLGFFPLKKPSLRDFKIGAPALLIPVAAFFLIPLASSLWLSLILALASILIARTSQEKNLLWAASVWIALSESFTLFDRMNTVFKTYNLLWVSLLLVAAIVIHRTKIKSAVAITLALSLTASGFVTVSFLVDQKVPGPRPTLDGTAYLETTDPDELEMFQWIRKNVKGTPRIAEAFGDIYGPYARVAMHTGLPTYLGWDWHVIQRGAPETEIKKRKDELTRLFTSTDPDELKSLIREMGIQYVVHSQLEKSAYGKEGVAFLSQFEIVFSKNQTKLLHVKSPGP